MCEQNVRRRRPKWYFTLAAPAAAHAAALCRRRAHSPRGRFRSIQAPGRVGYMGRVRGLPPSPGADFGPSRGEGAPSRGPILAHPTRRVATPLTSPGRPSRLPGVPARAVTVKNPRGGPPWTVITSSKATAFSTPPWPSRLRACDDRLMIAKFHNRDASFSGGPSLGTDPRVRRAAISAPSALDGLSTPRNRW